jgi:hypothetical protein
LAEVKCLPAASGILCTNLLRVDIEAFSRQIKTLALFFKNDIVKTNFHRKPPTDFSKFTGGITSKLK